MKRRCGWWHRAPDRPKSLANLAEAGMQVGEGYSERIAKLRQVAWVADAPMFIDTRLVESFFDAVVRPKFEHESTSEENMEEKEKRLRGQLGLSGEAGIDLPDWLKALKVVPSLKVTAEGEGETEGTSHSRKAMITQLKPIWNAERQIEELARHYLLHYPNHVFFCDGVLVESQGLSVRWWEPGVDLAEIMPKPLAFLEFSERTALLPMAAEFADGQIMLLYDELAKQLTSEKGGPLREFPGDDVQGDERLKQRRAYWLSFQSYFRSRTAMQVIEDASTKHGRINWIDFRVLMNDSGDTLHVHIVPDGRAAAGTFGYNFVRRAFTHGVRLIGTIKSGPAMNLMAIYER
jgi:hypothetical protein